MQAISSTLSRLPVGSGPTGAMPSSAPDAAEALLETLQLEAALLGVGADAPGEGAQALQQPALPQLAQAGAVQGDAGAGTPGQLTPEQQEAVSTLSRHEGEFSKHGTKMGDIEKMAKDPKTPPDLQKAIGTVMADPDLKKQLDGNGDGKISSKDIKRMADKPEVKAFNEDKAQAYAKDYIPSDAPKGTQPRPITKQDAEQELYKYADYLPKNMSQKDQQNIVDGTSGMGKCPPQVIAAAQYFKDNPDEWKALNDGKDKVKTAKLEDNIAAKGEITQDEKDAVDRLTDDPNHVFGNKITRDSLKKIADDPKADPADRKAAQKFLDDPVIFGKEDNAKNGRDIHGIKKLWQQSDDGTISRDDLKAFQKKLQDTKVYTPPTAPAGGPQTAVDAYAANDMLAGEMDQPDQKKAKGGGFKKFLQGALSVLSKIEHGFSVALGAIAKIMPPGLRQLVGLASTATGTISGLEKTGADAIGGGNWKKDLADTGISTAGSLVDAATGTSVGGTVAGIAQGAVDAKMDGGSGQDIAKGAALGAL